MPSAYCIMHTAEDVQVLPQMQRGGPLSFPLRGLSIPSQQRSTAVSSMQYALGTKHHNAQGSTSFVSIKTTICSLAAEKHCSKQYAIGTRH